MRGSARIYDVRMAQFVLKIENLSHIIGARVSQDLRSSSRFVHKRSGNESITVSVPDYGYWFVISHTFEEIVWTKDDHLIF